MNNEVYDAREIPLSNDPDLRRAQEKILNNEPLTISQKVILGRDHPVKEIDGYTLKPYCVYRAISLSTYESYLKKGYVYSPKPNDEYEEVIIDNQVYNNNKGINWYLGGVCPKYGEVIIEAIAYKKYFQPAYDNGCHMSYDPTIRHFKSSGTLNPVPIQIVKVIKSPEQKLNDSLKL